MTYFLARGGQQYGPYSLDGIKRMVAEGSAQATDLVWQEGMPNWVPLIQLIPVGPPPLPRMPGYEVHGGTGPFLMPPKLHWVLVLVFSLLTGGIFYWVWCFIESNFVKKLDGSNSSRILLWCAVIASIASAIVSINDDEGPGKLLEVAGVVFMQIANFTMRGVVERYYNTVEPIGLRLSGVMTFFFGAIYLQYHLNRIANWKRTGYL